MATTVTVADPIEAAHILPATYLDFTMKIPQREIFSGSSAMKPRLLTVVIWITKDAEGYFNLDRDKILDAALSTWEIWGAKRTNLGLTKIQ